MTEGWEGLKIVEKTVSNSFGYKCSDLLNGGSLTGFVEKDIRRSAIPSRLRQVAFLPDDLSGSFFQRQIDNTRMLIFQNKTGSIIRNGSNVKILNNSFQSGICIPPIQNLDPSFPNEFSSEALW